MRTTVAGHLGAGDLGRDQILACAAHLLDIGFFRVGSEDYAEENGTYGLATLLKRHVTIGAGSVTFDYVAKDSKRRIQSFVDPVVADILTQLKTRRGGGRHLLAYRRDTGWAGVSAGEINDYLRVVTGINCSAKDFRTWNATVIAAVALAVGTGAPSATARKRWVRQAMNEVAHYLGNTPAVARASYVDPRIVDSYLSGQTIRPALGDLTGPEPDPGARGGQDSPIALCTHGPIEDAVVGLLEDHAAPLVA
jgi:DNA topoisomerase-1